MFTKYDMWVGVTAMALRNRSTTSTLQLSQAQQFFLKYGTMGDTDISFNFGDESTSSNKECTQVEDPKGTITSQTV